MSANKMFEAKAKLFTKEQNVKPKHKPSIEYGDMEKLNKYFMVGQNNGIWRNPEKLVEFVWFSLCYHFARRGRIIIARPRSINCTLAPLGRK